MPRGVTQRTKEIRRFILKNLPGHVLDIVAFTADHFGLSRQGVHRHIKALIAAGWVETSGRTANTTYHLAIKDEGGYRYALRGLEEDEVWKRDLSKHMSDFSKNVREIWEYGITEMVNNAVDHSNGQFVEIRVGSCPVSVLVSVQDDGVGIFRKIARECHLEDERHAVLELAKGKLTTDPANHTGEGIFFSSRCFDLFRIDSGGTTFDHNEQINDENWIFQASDRVEGTMVFMLLQNDSQRTLESVFNKFASEDDDYAFSKTVVPVSLLRHGEENLVSRSQAKRLMARVEMFRTVVLDFHQVEKIGQAFADEIFRVFVTRHPDVKVIPLRANVNVRRDDQTR